MAKIYALYINELIKISRKTSVYVILIIMAAGMFITGEIYKSSKAHYQSMQTQPDTPGTVQENKSAMEKNLATVQAQLTQTNTEIAAASPAQKRQLEVDATNLRYQIDSLNTAIKLGIYLNSNYYIALALQDVSSYKTELNDLQALPVDRLSKTQKDEETLLTSLISKMQDAITKKDFKEYTEVINQKLHSDSDMSKTDKEIQLEQNNLRLKYNVTNEDENHLPDHSTTVTMGVTQTASVTPDDIINGIGSARRSLAYNLDFVANQDSPVSMTPERRAQISDNIAVYLKQLDTGSIQTDHFSLMNDVMSVGIFFIEVLLLILSGGAISQELSTGSIKSLIISPTKRWKIYTAKLLSLITVGIISAVICYAVEILAFGIFFGSGHISPYIYVSSGKAQLMNFYLFTFAKLFIGLIPVLFYLVLALMLSTITRNTSTSVGISIGVLFGSTMVYSILAGLLKGEWLKFLPFSNFDFVSKILTFDPSIAPSSGVNTTLVFSAIYMIIFICIMFYIGLNSFMRRDIK